MSTRQRLLSIYNRLLKAFGPQDWWPGDTQYEIMIGAVLTQNTNWGNVERAIANLKAANLLDARRMAECGPQRLAQLIRPSGYFNVKARRLKALNDWLLARGDAPFRIRTGALRGELLGISGIGPETADSILLYALGRRKFVVDAYTRRIFSRHGLVQATATYDEIQTLFEANLPASVPLYNEYHALIVRAGKTFCRPRPLCGECPLRRDFARGGASSILRE